MARAIEVPIPTAFVQESTETQDINQYIEDCEDEDFFDQHEAHILNKTGKTQALWPVKPGQRKIDEVFYRQMAERGFVRMLVAKARRVGSSTRL